MVSDLLDRPESMLIRGWPMTKLSGLGVVLVNRRSFSGQAYTCHSRVDKT